MELGLSMVKIQVSRLKVPMVKMEKMVSIMNPMLKLIHGGKLKVIKRLTQAFHTWQKVQLPLYMIK
ncbi:hypothetical protein [Eubacterium ventriosum]